MVFLLVFFFWDSNDSNVGSFNIVPEVSEVLFILKKIFFLFSCLLHLFLPFYLLPHLSYLLPPLFYCWFPPECFFTSFIALIIISVQFSRSVVSNSLQPHESQHYRPPCPSPTPGVYSNSYPLSQ